MILSKIRGNVKVSKTEERIQEAWSNRERTFKLKEGHP